MFARVHRVQPRRDHFADEGTVRGPAVAVCRTGEVTVHSGTAPYSACGYTLEYAIEHHQSHGHSSLGLRTVCGRSGTQCGITVGVDRAQRPCDAPADRHDVALE